MRSEVTVRFTKYCDLFFNKTKQTLTSPIILQHVGVLDNNYEMSHSTTTYVAVVNCTIVLVAIFIFYNTWKVLFSPMDTFHDIGKIGYVHHDKRIKKHEAVNIARRQREIGNVPPVYPNGWFRLCDSNMLRNGQLKNIFALGEQLAVFRNEKGEVRVLDALCPHMGANMATGGRVVGSDCLECPFHGWIFSGETGVCVDIPYTEKIPKQAFVRKWPVCEVNGVIYVWYHCDHEEPSWTIPVIPGLEKLKYVGRTEHIVNSHIQEIPENAADFAHLGHLHKPVFGRDVENTYGQFSEIVQHKIQAFWKADERKHHRATLHIQDDTHLQLFGMKIPIKTFIFDIEQLGPGNVHIHMNTPYFRGVMIQTATPTEPLLQRLHHTLHIDPRVPMIFAKTFFHLQATQIERDIMVWNNKKYLKAPMLVKEESAIMKHRKWFKQFYSENSPRLNSSGTGIKNSDSLRNIYDW